MREFEEYFDAFRVNYIVSFILKIVTESARDWATSSLRVRAGAGDVQAGLKRLEENYIPRSGL